MKRGQLPRSDVIPVVGTLDALIFLFHRAHMLSSLVLLALQSGRCVPTLNSGAPDSHQAGLAVGRRAPVFGTEPREGAIARGDDAGCAHIALLLQRKLTKRRASLHAADLPAVNLHRDLPRNQHIKRIAHVVLLEHWLAPSRRDKCQVFDELHLHVRRRHSLLNVLHPSHPAIE